MDEPPGRHRRFRRRAQWMTALVLAGVLASAATASSALGTVYAVNTYASDAADATSGTGPCEATSGAGDCTLRAAVQSANVHANSGGPDRVVLAPGTDTVLSVAG